MSNLNPRIKTYRVMFELTKQNSIRDLENTIDMISRYRDDFLLE